MNGHARSDSASDEPEAPCQTTGDINITLASIVMERLRAQWRERSRKYRAANPEKGREYLRKYYVANREKLLAYQRKWYAKNREKVKESKDREKVREYKRKWYAKNREKVKERQRIRRRQE